SVAPDGSGGILYGWNNRLFQFTPPPTGSAPGTWSEIRLPLTLDQYITTLYRDSIGILWIGTRDGLLKYSMGEVPRYSRAEGLSDSWIRVISEDRDGNLWIGTTAGGLDRLNRQGGVSFGLSEGLRDPNIARLVEARDGRLYAATGRGGLVEVRGRE